MKEFIEKKHFTDSGVPLSKGNLYESFEESSSISGGWSEESKRKENNKASNKILFSAGLLVGAAAVGAGVLSTRKRLKKSYKLF